MWRMEYEARSSKRARACDGGDIVRKGVATTRAVPVDIDYRRRRCSVARAAPDMRLHDQ